MMVVDWPVSVHLKLILVCVATVALLLASYQIGVRYAVYRDRFRSEQAAYPATGRHFDSLTNNRAGRRPAAARHHNGARSPSM